MKNIGQVSQLTGLSPRMLRYFEEQELLQPARAHAGVRQFTDAHIAEILRIRQLHALGFTYPEIHTLLAASPEELARRGTLLLERHHAAAEDLRHRIQNLEILCFGAPLSAPAKKPATHPAHPSHPAHPAHPARTAYSVRGMDDAGSQFANLAQLAPAEFTFSKAAWFAQPSEAPCTLFEVLEASALLLVFQGEEHLPTFEKAWEQSTGLKFGARPLGSFTAEDLPQFFGAHEVVLEQNHAGGAGFRALLPYAALLGRLGRAPAADPVSDRPTLGAVSFRPIDREAESDLAILARWHADVSIRHLAFPHRDEAALAKTVTTADLRRTPRKGEPFVPVEDDFILVDGRPVGSCSLTINPPHRLIRDRKVAWVSLLVGEEKMRAQGLGEKVAMHLEALALHHGAEVAEAGVFEFNEPALRLVRRLGLEPIGQADDATYWRGRKWADLRFRKELKKS